MWVIVDNSGYLYMVIPIIKGAIWAITRRSYVQIMQLCKSKISAPIITAQARTYTSPSPSRGVSSNDYIKS